MGDSSISIYDGLDSTSALKALSAKQGNVLYNMITNTATDDDIDALFM